MCGLQIIKEILERGRLNMSIYAEAVKCDFDVVTIEKLMFLEHVMEHMIELDSLLKPGIECE